MSDEAAVLADLEQRLAKVQRSLTPVPSQSKGPRNLPKPSARKAARTRQRAGRKANRA